MGRPTIRQAQINKVKGLVIDELIRRNDLTEVSTAELLKMYTGLTKMTLEEEKLVRSAPFQTSPIEKLIEEYTGGTDE